MSKTPLGSAIENKFVACGDRYYWDARCTKATGWSQYDTTQDAWYFGVWINKQERKIICYCEGDISITTSPDDKTFELEMQQLNDFHGTPPPAAIGYDADGTRTEYYDNEAAHGRELPK